MLMSDRQKLMQYAVDLAVENVRSGKGGPFAAIVVRNGEIIAEGANHVTTWNDPTAHAEVVAIREACKKLGTFQLDDCEVYTTCEPCPMCMGAIYWARPKVVYYACHQADAADAGFDDQFIYDEINVPYEQRKIPFYTIGREDATRIFDEWKVKTDKTDY
jgi:guanine deaminase